MRILKFTVNRQHIEKAPECDFSGLVAGTKGYLKAEFSFSEEWNNCAKAAVFTRLGRSFPVPIINGICDIPPEALDRKQFSVSVVGERNGYRIVTDKVEVRQDE